MPNASTTPASAAAAVKSNSNATAAPIAMPIIDAPKVSALGERQPRRRNSRNAGTPNASVAAYATGRAYIDQIGAISTWVIGGSMPHDEVKPQIAIVIPKRSAGTSGTIKKATMIRFTMTPN